MGIIASLALIVCGGLAAANLIVQKQPNAREAIEKLRPYQGWIGVVVALCGAWMLIWALLSFGWFSFGVRGVIWWLTFTLTGALEFALGFLLGYPILSQWLAKSADARQRGQQLQEKLALYQVPLGLAGIAVGVWCLIGNFILL